MDAYLIAVYAHVLLGMALVGYALYCAILALGSPRPDGTRRASNDSPSILRLAQRAPWPPRGLPVPVRVPTWALGWLLLGAVVASGIAAIGWDGLVASLEHGATAWISLRSKVLAVGLASIWMLFSCLRPGRASAFALLATLLLIVVLSGALVR